jgi:hypothetical protein
MGLEEFLTAKILCQVDEERNKSWRFKKRIVRHGLKASDHVIIKARDMSTAPISPSPLLFATRSTLQEQRQQITNNSAFTVPHGEMLNL